MFALLYPPILCTVGTISLYSFTFTCIFFLKYVKQVKAPFLSANVTVTCEDRGGNSERDTRRSDKHLSDSGGPDS